MQCIIYDISAGALLSIFADDHSAWYMMLGALLMGLAAQPVIHTLCLGTRNSLVKLAFLAIAVLSGAGIVYIVDLEIASHVYQWHDFVYCVSGGAFFGLLYLAFATYQDKQARLKQTMKLLAQRQKRTEEQLELNRYRLLAAQIKPHFLFNVLTNLHALVTIDPKRAETLLEEFTEYLSDIIYHTQKNSIPLSTELATVKTYLAIENERMRRLTCDFDIPGELNNLRVPPLSLLTLAENAIKHGVSKRPGPARIRLTAGIGGTGRDAWIEVEDNGAGFAPDAPTSLANHGARTSTKSGIGLANVRERLRMLHGDGSELSVHPGKTCGCVARITIPLPAPDPAVTPSPVPSTAIATP